MSASTVGGEPAKVLGLRFPQASVLCRALGARYPGIKFNQVHVELSHDYWLGKYPDADSVQVAFFVSGARPDLERHGFGHPSWFEALPKCGACTLDKVPGFCGNGAGLQRTATGFRLTYLTLDDGLTRLAQLGVGLCEYGERFAEVGAIWAPPRKALRP